jgi:hypothetical protein
LKLTLLPVSVGSRKHGSIHLRFEVFTALTVTNAVFWDIKLSSYLTGHTFTFPLQSPAG